MLRCAIRCRRCNTVFNVETRALLLFAAVLRVTELSVIGTSILPRLCVHFLLGVVYASASSRSSCGNLDGVEIASP